MRRLTLVTGWPYPRVVPPLSGTTSDTRNAVLAELAKLGRQQPRRRLEDGSRRVNLLKNATWSTCMRNGLVVCTCSACTPQACGGAS